MHALQPIDYGIIALYFLLTLVVGVAMTRTASRSMDHYFLGGRRLPWWLLGIAGMTNWFDLTGTMVITSFLYMLGPRGLFVEFRGGAVLVLAFLLAYAGKWHRRSGCVTGAEWMTYRFGTGPAAAGVRLLSAIVGLVGTVAMIAYLIRGTSLFLGTFFPWPPMTMTLVLIAITTLYTMSAGFYGVVLTDLVQGAIMMVACVVVAVMAWRIVPDAAHLAETARQVTGNPEWTGSLPGWHTPMPPGYGMYEGLLVIAGFYLLRNILGGMGGGAEARYFAAKSDRECGLQSMLQGLTVMLRWPMMAGFAVMGIYMVHGAFPDASMVGSAASLIKQYHPGASAPYWHDLTAAIVSHPASQPPELIDGLSATLGSEWHWKLPLVGFHGAVNPEQVLPAVLLGQIPTGLKGLLLVAMFAALMSSKNGLVNGASALFVKDIYQNFVRPGAGNRELITAAYLSTLGVVAIGFYLGVTASSINDLWGWIVMSFGAGLIAPGMLRLYWWRCNAWGVFGGLMLGGSGAVLQRVLLPSLPEWQQFVMMGTLSVAGTIAGSLLTPPTPADRLDHFYRTTRPFGWWGPVRRRLEAAGEFPPARLSALRREHRADIITVPIALVWQVTLFLLPMQLVVKRYDAFLLTLPVWLVASCGMYWFWWRNLPLAAQVDAEGPGTTAPPTAAATAAAP